MASRPTPFSVSLAVGIPAVISFAAAALLSGCAEPVPPARAPGAITGHATDRLTGAPIAGARVWLPGTTIATTTDRTGAFALAVPAGVADVMPAGSATADVMIDASGYLTMRRASIPVAPAVAATIDLALFPAALSTEGEIDLLRRRAVAADTGDLTPRARDLLARIAATPESPTLRELDAAAPAAAPAAGDDDPGRAQYALSAPPATIRVWRRGLDGSTASCSGRVDVIPFETYVKGVLPHEWIPSWDPLSLEMGAVAIRTYAWWWIEAGGKYDCADLDDTTASQVYEDEYLPKTDAAVDATAGVSIVRDGSLVFAEYSAENSDPTDFGVDEPYCSGLAVFGHGRGTCQWGTQRWATNEAKDFVWMSAHYYPGAVANIPGPQLDADFHAESYPPVMTSGEEAVVWIEYTNTGATTWDPELTRLGTTEPRDRPSPFYKDGNWLSPNRPTGADHSDYSTGATGRFSFVLLAPEVTEETTFVEHFALVQEGATWFGPEDTAVTWTITVKPRVTSDPPADGVPADPVVPPDEAAGSGVFGGCRVSAGRPRVSSIDGMSRLALLAVLGLAALRRGRRWALLFVLLLAAGAAGCADDRPGSAGEARVDLGGDSRLVPLFRAAGEEHRVPAELLATVAFVQTRLRMNLDREQAHGAPEHGMMTLGITAASDLHRAAALVGRDPVDVATDEEWNVRAAAAVLRAEMDATGREPGSLADWAPALAAYGGDALVEQVMWRLERGWRGLDDSKGWVVASARGVGAGGEMTGVGQQRYQLGYPGAIWNPAYSGNYQASSRGAADINYIVIHTVQGSYAGCISWFQNPSASVSAHYVVRSSDGEITQMVDDSDVAWHDACFNSQTIGIEHEGYVGDPDAWYTEAMYMASAQLTSWLADQYGIPKDHDHIMGHGEAPDCSDHTDPGSGWDWAHYLDLVVTGGTPVFDAGDASSWSYPPEMVSGDEAVAWFEFVNQGNSTWGLDETRLGTQDPQDRDSPFFVDGNWISPSRATGADHSNYGPGSTGRFTFAIKAPEVTEDTLFVETFQLVQEGVTWFGPKVTMTILVKPRVAPVPPADPLDPSDPIADPDEAGGSTGVAGGCAAGAPSRGGGDGSAGFALLLGCAILGLGVAARRRK